MTKIRKALITEFGDESKITVVEGEIADPAAGEVQVQVEYSAVSGADINMRKGIYPFQKKAPLTPGYSIVGRVSVNGAGCRAFQIGDRVVCLTKYEGQAERINLPERFLVPVPQGVDPGPAVALVVDWTTAYQMVTHAAHVGRGKRVFVHGLSGAVGSALLALARMQGAEVYGTASLRNHAALRELGATPSVYTDKGWIHAMKALGGVDAVFDPLGFESFDESYSILRRGGILVGYGLNLPTLSKTPPRPFLPAVLGLFAKNLWFWTGKRTTFYGLDRKSSNFLPDLKALLGLLEKGDITVPIKAVYKLANIRDAHREWANGTGMGSILVEVQS